MTYYHVRIGWKAKEGYRIDAAEFDLDEIKLSQMVFEPIKNNHRFFFGSKSIEPSKIESLSIYSTIEKASSYTQTQPGITNFHMIVKVGTNVTRDFTVPLATVSSVHHMEFDTTQVFIVHGRDDNAKLELARIIDKDLGLNSIILHEQPNAGRTLIEKLERYSSSPGFAFVLLTPDDLGSFKEDSDLKPRARQNVILELGYFIGKIGRDRVCCIYKDEVELPSDISGVIYISFQNKVAECYADIRKELKQAGYKISD